MLAKTCTHCASKSSAPTKPPARSVASWPAMKTYSAAPLTRVICEYCPSGLPRPSGLTMLISAAMTPPSTASAVLQQMPPLRGDLRVQLGARAHGRREVRHRLERLARDDDGARVEVRGLGLARVEGPAPRAADDVDVLCAVAARRHRPQDVHVAGGVDVLVDDDHPAADVVAGVAARGEQARLLRVPRVRLLDRDDVEQPPAARLVAPHALHAREAGFLDLVPDHGGLHHALRERIVGRRAARP